MKRREILEVWNPDVSDEVFIVDSDGSQLETMTDSTDDYLGQHLTGETVSFDFYFPNAGVMGETVLEQILSYDEFQYGESISNDQYTVYDRKNKSVFDIGVESPTQIVVHAKAVTGRETMREVYQQITSVVECPVRVVNTRTVYE